MADTAAVIRTAQLLGISTSLCLGGIYFPSSYFFLPILYRQKPEVSVDIWAELYHRGAATVVPLAIFSTLSSATVAYLLPAQRLVWTGVAVVTISSMPWTLVAMMDTNNALLKLADMKGEKFQEEAKKVDIVALLKKWKWMNFVRAGLGLMGGVLATAAVVFEL